MAYEARYVLRPNPGADLGAIIDALKVGAALWKKHGAPDPQLWRWSQANWQYRPYRAVRERDGVRQR